MRRRVGVSIWLGSEGCDRIVSCFFEGIPSKYPLDSVWIKYESGALEVSVTCPESGRDMVQRRDDVLLNSTSMSLATETYGASLAQQIADKGQLRA